VHRKLDASSLAYHLFKMLIMGIILRARVINGAMTGSASKVCTVFPPREIPMHPAFCASRPVTATRPGSITIGYPLH